MSGLRGLRTANHHLDSKLSPADDTNDDCVNQEQSPGRSGDCGTVTFDEEPVSVPGLIKFGRIEYRGYVTLKMSRTWSNFCPHGPQDKVNHLARAQDLFMQFPKECYTGLA